MFRALLLAAALGLATGSLSSAALAEGDPEAGKKVFRKCVACHSLEAGKKKAGPSLYGVVSSVPGTVEGYKYSKAMKAFGEAGDVWDEAVLDAFLEAPR